MNAAACSNCSWSYKGADLAEQVRRHRLIHPGGLQSVPADRPAEPENSDEEANPMVRCKIPGCDNESAGKRGPWQGICQNHISAAMTERSAKRYAAKTTAAGSRADPPASQNGTAHVSLVALAQAVEDAETRLREARDLLRAALA